MKRILPNDSINLASKKLELVNETHEIMDPIFNTDFNTINIEQKLNKEPLLDLGLRSAPAMTSPKNTTPTTTQTNKVSDTKITTLLPAEVFQPSVQKTDPNNSPKISDEEIKKLTEMSKDAVTYLNKMDMLLGVCAATGENIDATNETVKLYVRNTLSITQEIQAQCVSFNNKPMTPEQSLLIQKLLELANNSSSRATKQSVLDEENYIANFKHNLQNALNKNGVTQRAGSIDAVANDNGTRTIKGLDNNGEAIPYWRVDISKDGAVSAPSLESTNTSEEKLLVAKTMVAAYAASGHTNTPVSIQSADLEMLALLKKELKAAGFKLESTEAQPSQPIRNVSSKQEHETDDRRYSPQ